jgi:O-antigen/teichoic acid export membrane protein
LIHDGPAPDADAAPLVLANTAYRAAADVGSKLVSVVFFVVLARELGDDGFGIFTFGLALAAIVTVLAGFGQDLVLAREVARDRGRVAEYFANTNGLKLAVALPGVALAVAVMALVGADDETVAVVALLGVALTAELLTNTSFAVYQAFERLVYVPVVIISQRLFTAVVAIAALVAGADVIAVAAIYLAGSLLALGLAVAIQFARFGRPSIAIDIGVWPRLMRAALPIGVATAFQVVVFRVDAALLAAFEPAAVVGDYGAAFRLFEATLFVSWAVTAAVYPAVARLAASAELEVGEMLDRSLKLTLAAVAPAAVGAALLADPLVRLLYGEEFSEGAVALQILAPAIVLYSLAYVSGGVLVARNRQRVLAWANGAVAVGSVAANLALIPLLSLRGAALVATAAQLVLSAVLLTEASRVAGRRRWARILLGPALASAAAAGTMALLRDELGVAIAAGLAAYVVVLALVERSAYPADAAAVGGFLRRRRA